MGLTIPKEMRAVQIIGPGQVRIVNVPVPEVGPNMEMLPTGFPIGTAG